MAETIRFAVDQSCTKDDAEMVGAAQHSLAGFKPLYLKWLSPVYRYFYYRVGNTKDAEDLTSQVFLKVYEELPRYRDRGHFSAWLFTIVRNKTSDFFRSEHPDISIETIDLMDKTNDLLTQAVQTDELLRLNRLIQSLPDEEKELIRLRFVVELGYKEIGAILDRKEDAVRKSISRLLDRMQSQLEVDHE